MNYFVIGADGQKYGPADIPTLNNWAQEGRLLSTSMLEDASTGVQILAATVGGINFPASAPQANFQQPGYGQAPGMMFSDDGSEDVKKVWLYGGLAFIPCCLFTLIFGILAIVSAANAQKKGNPKAGTAMGFAIFSLVGGIVFATVLRLVFYGVASNIK